MNLKTLSLLSGVALAAFAVPAVEAAGRGGGAGAHVSTAPTGTQFAGSAAARPQFAPSAGSRPQVPALAGSRQQFAGSGGHYNHGPGYGGSRHPRYRPRYGGFYYGGYPYYNYPFGYGYGYGYPYFGSSAALYYYGTHPYGRAQYSDVASDENVAVSVQRRLGEAGYYRGAIDGVIGNGTRNAIRAYERANGLPVDGRIDAQLLARLRIS
jgi:hypothetical protein